MSYLVIRYEYACTYILDFLPLFSVVLRTTETVLRTQNFCFVCVCEQCMCVCVCVCVCVHVCAFTPAMPFRFVVVHSIQYLVTNFCCCTANSFSISCLYSLLCCVRQKLSFATKPFVACLCVYSVCVYVCAAHEKICCHLLKRCVFRFCCFVVMCAILDFFSDDMSVYPRSSAFVLCCIAHDSHPNLLVLYGKVSMHGNFNISLILFTHPPSLQYATEAVCMANRDVGGFGADDVRVFIANTWSLLPESNPTLRIPGLFTLEVSSAKKEKRNNEV